MWPAPKNDRVGRRKVGVNTQIKVSTYSMKAAMKKSIKLAAAIASVILLQACSGHPGAGHWQVSSEVASTDPVSSQYSELEIEFDGKGTLHPNKAIPGQEKQADLWCVWQAKSAIALDVQCGDGSAEKTNIEFELTVTGEKQEGAHAYNQASLSKDGSIVASFTRKP